MAHLLLSEWSDDLALQLLTSSSPVGRTVIRVTSTVTEFCRLSTPQFLVLLLGVSLCIVSRVHMSRRAEIVDLRSSLGTLQAQGQLLKERISEVQVQRDALEKDPFYRKESLIKITGQRLRGEVPLRDLLQDSSGGAPTP